MNNVAVKDYALKCSAEIKHGKFTRVGSDFLAEIQVEFEAIIRGIGGKITLNFPEVTRDERPLLDLSDRTKLYDVFTRLLTRLIQQRVEGQPSCGQTLGRTK